MQGPEVQSTSHIVAFLSALKGFMVELSFNLHETMLYLEDLGSNWVNREASNLLKVLWDIQSLLGAPLWKEGQQNEKTKISLQGSIKCLITSSRK